MKTLVRGTMIVAMVLAMVLAYLGGAYASTHTSSAPTDQHARILSPAQWAELGAANDLLLLDSDDDAPVYLHTFYLPLALKY